jgi:hypothetical protein
MIDGFLRHHQPAGDLGVAEALDQEREHLQLTCCQSGWVLSCPPAGAAWDPADALLPQPMGDDRGAWPGAEAL